MEILTPDLAIAIGGVVGLLSKAYALRDSQTTWSRKSSVTNVVFFIPTLWGFYELGTYLTFATTSISFMIWTGIAIWRSPQDENVVQEIREFILDRR